MNTLLLSTQPKGATSWEIIGLLAVIAILGVVGFIIAKIYEKKKKSSSIEPKQEPVKPKIKSAKVLGVRTAEQTKILATYNYTVYSILIIYEDDTREVIECDGDSAEFKELLPYMGNDNEKNT